MTPSEERARDSNSAPVTRASVERGTGRFSHIRFSKTRFSFVISSEAGNLPSAPNRKPPSDSESVEACHSCGYLKLSVSANRIDACDHTAVRSRAREIERQPRTWKTCRG